MSKKLVYRLLLTGRHLYAKVGIQVSDHSTKMCQLCLDTVTPSLKYRLLKWYGCKLVRLSRFMVDKYISYSSFVTHYGKGLI